MPPLFLPLILVFRFHKSQMCLELRHIKYSIIVSNMGKKSAKYIRNISHVFLRFFYALKKLNMQENKCI